VNGGRGKRRFLLMLCLLCTLGFGALGVWQVERLSWKLDLIERIDRRVHARAVPLPPSPSWPAFDAERGEYRHVVARGRFLHDRETLVDALTERGPGFWVITPLRTADGIILINRGYVPTDRKGAATRAAGQVAGEVAVKGLVRTTEPGGRFLRANAPAQDRWFSRDAAAIARARKLETTAPFFIDADSSPNPGGYPVGGMTVLQFRNAHLIYAGTWFALAALSLAGLVLVARSRDTGR
jgi:surfeit locus 1 family protein